MEFYFLHFLTLWRPLGYVIAFLGMIFEGDIILFTAAFFTHQGLFSFPLMLGVVVSGTIIGDILWFLLGAWLQGKENKFIYFLGRITSPFDRRLTEKLFGTLFLTKFMYGIHHAVLVRAGMLGIDGKKFIKSDARAGVLWIGIIGALGYGASASFSHARRYLKFAELALLFVFVGFIFLESIIRFILDRIIPRA